MRRSTGKARAGGLGLAGLIALSAPPAEAQTSIPTSDTENAELGSLEVGRGRLHPFVTADVRNGDYARGSYDDDASDLGRVPAHVQLGFAFDLHRGADGEADAFLLGESSNGFHAPGRGESGSLSPWYESNNLVGLAVRPTKGLTAAVTYTNKRSPNGVGDVTHEASLAVAYEAKSGPGSFHPTASFTGRPAAGRGVYTQVGIEPRLALGQAELAPKFSPSAHLGVGWGGFYQSGTGTVTYGDVGVALVKPFKVGGRTVSLRSEILALIRDRTLRALDGADANRAAVVPLATFSLSTGF